MDWPKELGQFFPLYPNVAHSLGEFQREFNNRTVYTKQCSTPGLVTVGPLLPWAWRNERREQLVEQGGEQWCGKEWAKPAQCGPIGRSQEYRPQITLFSSVSYWADLTQMTEGQGACWCSPGRPASWDTEEVERKEPIWRSTPLPPTILEMT